MGFSFLGVFRGADEGGGGIAAHDVGKEGEGFVAEAVAGGEGFGVGGVFAEGDCLFFEEGGDLGAAEVEEGAEEGEGGAGDVDCLLFPDAGESGGSAEEAEEDGLGLVICVMGEEDVVGAGFLGALPEEVVSGIAGGGLEGEGGGGEVGLFGEEGEVEGGGELLDEELVGVRSGSAEAVVEVAEGEVLEAGLVKEVEEADGVPSAGDAEEVALIGVQPGGKGHGVSAFSKIMRCCQGRSCLVPAHCNPAAAISFLAWASDILWRGLMGTVGSSARYSRRKMRPSGLRALTRERIIS